MQRDPLWGRRTPIELDPEEFARLGHKLVDDIARLLRDMPERLLTRGETPEDVRAILRADASMPEEGMEAGPLLAEATDLLFEHSLYNGHPRFFGYISGAPAPIGLLGDLLASAVNPNTGAWVLSPMASEIEGQAVRWIAELLGYPASCDGVLVSGGNVANLLGFWAARAAKAGWDVRAEGLRGEGSARLRVYAAEGTHTWLQKAADLGGLGAEGVRWIGTDRDARMDTAELRARIEEDREAGDRPFLVVGTAGSVATGAVDPLPEIRAICDEHDLWMHVDGAYGGFAVLARESVPEDLLGLSLGDSLAVDPHKWLYAPLEAGCTLVRDPEALVRAFAFRPDYYNFGDEATNYFEHGLQNSRGFRALKVWLQLRQVGREGYERMVAEDIELARRFASLCRTHPELEPVTQRLSITTYRYVPTDLCPRTLEPEVAAYLDELNRALQNRMERGGRAFVSNAVVGERYLLRMCVVNFRTRMEDVRDLADHTLELGRELDLELRPPGLR